MRPGRNYPLPPKDVPKGKPNIVFILTDEYVVAHEGRSWLCMFCDGDDALTLRSIDVPAARTIDSAVSA
jgi:hypothetical protein